MKDLITIYRSSDPGSIALIKSLLEGENIRYMARGDSLMQTGIGFVFGDVEILVHQDDEVAAITIVRAVQSSKPIDDQIENDTI